MYSREHVQCMHIVAQIFVRFRYIQMIIDTLLRDYDDEDVVLRKQAARGRSDLRTALRFLQTSRSQKREAAAGER